MALGAAYPAEIIDANGNVSEGTTIQFTDDSNQPEPGDAFAGWTGTGDPADVSSNGGSLDLEAGDLHATGTVNFDAAAIAQLATTKVTVNPGDPGDAGLDMNQAAIVDAYSLAGTNFSITNAGVATFLAAAAPTSAPRLSQLTSALTITSGTLPNLGTWTSTTPIQNPVTRQITVNVAFVTNGTANAATCAIAISPDNVTYTTIGTLTASQAVNTVGAVQLVAPVNLPAGWYIKLTFVQGTVAASIYY